MRVGILNGQHPALSPVSDKLWQIVTLTQAQPKSRTSSQPGPSLGLTCASLLGALPRSSIVPALTGTDGGPFRVGCAMLGALETMRRVHISPVGTARAGWRETPQTHGRPVFHRQNHNSPTQYPNPLYGNTPASVSQALGHTVKKSLRWSIGFLPSLGTQEAHP